MLPSQVLCSNEKKCVVIEGRSIKLSHLFCFFLTSSSCKTVEVWEFGKKELFRMKSNPLMHVNMNR